MDNQGKEDYGDIGSEDFPDEFQCCVCLDIMYKPVVLACGHISCFWCVFKAMDSFGVSYCPVCRNPYNHFPSICRLLHFLLLKLYPSAYKRRERQVAEEEKKCGHASPHFDVFSDSCFSKELCTQDTSPHTAAMVFNMTQRRDSSLIQDSSVNEANMTMIPITSSQESTTNRAEQGDGMVKSEVTNEARRQFLMTDLQCPLCKQLFCRPIVLNCGHVYCEACINNLDNKVCRCPACQSVHPNGYPNVCLVLEHFLEEHFPEEYSARKVSLTDQLHRNPSGSMTRKQEQAAESSLLPRNAYLSLLSGLGRPRVHPAVGCDWCGMYPIVGERYKCKDCVEKIGFDLCEGCYKTSSKLPGRFNQQHTPEHQFVVEKPSIFRGFFLRSEAVPPEHHDSGSLDNTEEVVMFSNLSNDASEDEVDSAASLNLSPDALQDLGNSITSLVPFNNPSEDQEGTESGT